MAGRPKVLRGQHDARTALTSDILGRLLQVDDEGPHGHQGQAVDEGGGHCGQQPKVERTNQEVKNDRPEID